jgi:hypothetical protein
MGRVKSHADFKAIDGKKSQDDWVGLYNLIIKTHIIELGGESKEAKLITKKEIKKELEGITQNAGVSTEKHFEIFGDLVYKAQMVGLEIEEQELSYFLINSMRNDAARRKRGLDVTLEKELPNSLAFTMEYIKKAERGQKTNAALNSNTPSKGAGSILATRVGSGNGKGKTWPGNKGRRYGPAGNSNGGSPRSTGTGGSRKTVKFWRGGRNGSPARPKRVGDSAEQKSPADNKKKRKRKNGRDRSPTK